MDSKVHLPTRGGRTVDAEEASRGSGRQLCLRLLLARHGQGRGRLVPAQLCRSLDRAAGRVPAWQASLAGHREEILDRNLAANGEGSGHDTPLPLLHLLLPLLPEQRGRRPHLPQEGHPRFSNALGASALRDVLRLSRVHGCHGLGQDWFSRLVQAFVDLRVTTISLLPFLRADNVRSAGRGSSCLHFSLRDLFFGVLIG